MAVTPAGEIVRQGALRIERDIDGMLRDLEPFVSREAGTLRIVSNYGAAMNFLADGLARFLKAHPDVSISHHRCSSRDVVEAVAEDRSDIGLSAFVGDYPGVTFIDYARDDLVVIVSIDSPLAHREALDFAECLNEDFVSLSEHVEKCSVSSTKELENSATSSFPRFASPINQSSFRWPPQVLESVLPAASLSKHSPTRAPVR